MRIWKNIKVNDMVIHRDEEYIVLKIYKFDEEMYVDLRSIVTGKTCSVSLSSCRKNKN